jgi:hypothetical protein
MRRQLSIKKRNKSKKTKFINKSKKNRRYNKSKKYRKNSRIGGVFTPDSSRPSSVYSNSQFFNTPTTLSPTSINSGYTDNLSPLTITPSSHFVFPPTNQNEMNFNFSPDQSQGSLHLSDLGTNNSNSIRSGRTTIVSQGTNLSSDLSIEGGKNKKYRSRKYKYIKGGVYLDPNYGVFNPYPSIDFHE